VRHPAVSSSRSLRAPFFSPEELGLELTLDIDKA
jgi:hypothetical protein